VRILTNGVGSIDAAAASPDHAVAVEPAQAERIEVLRGAALLRYGSSGAGGVVNVIDGRIPRELPDGETDVALRIGASTVDNGTEAAASIDQRLGNFVLHLDGTRRNASDYRIPVEGESKILLAEEGEDVPDDFNESRRLENSFANSKSLSGGVSYIGENGFIGVSGHSFSSMESQVVMVMRKKKARNMTMRSTKRKNMITRAKRKKKKTSSSNSNNVVWI
jgi:iron complex outermembrane receptor protein